MNPDQSTPVKIGRFKASKMIVMESLAVLKQDKELVLFPVISGISSLIALIIMGIVFFFAVMSGDIHAFDNVDKSKMDILSYVILFIYYLIMFFITNYFLAGMYVIINGRFNGQELSFSDGMRGAKANISKIFLWSLISSTVGVILRIIADKSKIVGKIVAVIFGAAWNILTYFSLPSLIIGQKSVKDSFKESASIIRKTWGEVIIINFGVGLFFGLITFLFVITVVIIAILVPIFEIVILLSILSVIYLVAMSIVSSTLSSIFKLALYQYALTGSVPQGFTPALITGAVKGKV